MASGESAFEGVPDAVLLAWAATSFLLSAAMFLLHSGKLTDIHGRKRVFACGVAVYTLVSFLYGVSTSAWPLLASRVIQDIGGAMTFATGVALLTAVFPVGKRGKVLGSNVAAV